MIFLRFSIVLTVVLWCSSAHSVMAATLVTERWGTNSTTDHDSTTLTACVNKSYPTWTNGCTGEELFVRSDGQTGGFDSRAVLYFDLKALPASTAITNAKLLLYVNNVQTENNLQWQHVYALTDPNQRGLWSKDDMSFTERRAGTSWSKQGDITTALSDHAIAKAYLGNIAGYSGHWVEWDLTSTVADWVKDSVLNQGVYLPPQQLGLWSIPSDIATDKSLRPILQITYEAANNSTRPSPVQSVQAKFHSGQTFITWQELDHSRDIVYRVYRSAVPITADTIDQAALIAEVQPHSSYYQREDTCGTSGDTGCSPIGQTHYIIADDGQPLADDTGLLVYTVATVTSAQFYYAVTTVEAGNENRQDFGDNSVGPITEQRQTPRPIRVWTNATDTGWVYTQFMDYRRWNSAFEGYAYNFYVGIPGGYTGEKKFPAVLSLHAWGGDYSALMPSTNDDGTKNFDAIEILPDDRNLTWWFGFNKFTNQFERPFVKGKIVNYTHQRLDAMLEFVQQEFLVDSERIYAFGGSMGGSGLANYTLRRGETFAAVYMESAMTDFKNSGKYSEATDWPTSMISIWGTPQQNLLLPGGSTIWQWYNLQAWVKRHPKKTLPFIADHHGQNDNTIDWDSQGKPWYVALEQARMGYVGVFDESDHNWPGFRATTDIWNIHQLKFKKNESYLAFSDASNSDALDQPSGCRNCQIEWSSSWNNFAGIPVDTDQKYSVTLRTTNGSTATVNITPRRLQQFHPQKNTILHWKNSKADHTVIQSGTIKVKSKSMFTIPAVMVTAEGTYLTITAEE